MLGRFFRSCPVLPFRRDTNSTKTAFGNPRCSTPVEESKFQNSIEDSYRSFLGDLEYRKTLPPQITIPDMGEILLESYRERLELYNTREFETFERTRLLDSLSSQFDGCTPVMQLIIYGIVKLCRRIAKWFRDRPRKFTTVKLHPPVM